MLNLTQHRATDDQRAAGVVDLDTLDAQDHAVLLQLLTFDTLPHGLEVDRRAAAIADIAEKYRADHPVCMIGGAPFLMGPLESALFDRCIQAVYAFSRRESVEEVQADGSVVKRNVFRHEGFVYA